MRGNQGGGGKKKKVWAYLGKAGSAEMGLFRTTKWKAGRRRGGSAYYQK